jgi:ferredoxin, 2Fe-2S
MPKITYIEHGGKTHVVDVPIGNTVMEGGRNAGVEGIVAECGGACACATCHVYVDSEWIGRIAPKESMEADMLDFASATDPACSRLSCQIRITAELDGLVVKVPREQS